MNDPIQPGAAFHHDGALPFAQTGFGRRKARQESMARAVFLGMTLLMVAPLVAIVSHLVIQAWPALSLEFLLDILRERMTTGGIWPAFVGTIYLVVISLAVAAPIGVLADVYLNEYAKDRTAWLNAGSANTWNNGESKSL